MKLKVKPRKANDCNAHRFAKSLKSNSGNKITTKLYSKVASNLSNVLIQRFFYLVISLLKQLHWHYLKIDFHNWMTLQILLYYLLPFYSNIAFVGRSVERITKGALSFENDNGHGCSINSSCRENKIK